jgi:hypothetical protein
MKKIQALALAAFLSSMLFSCTSPEDAAQEVCDCMSKAMKSKSTSEVAGNASECAELQAKYTQKFEGEDQNKFSKKIVECTMGSLQLR